MLGDGGDQIVLPEVGPAAIRAPGIWVDAHAPGQNLKLRDLHAIDSASGGCGGHGGWGWLSVWALLQRRGMSNTQTYQLNSLTLTLPGNEAARGRSQLTYPLDRLVMGPGTA